MQTLTAIKTALTTYTIDEQGRKQGLQQCFLDSGHIDSEMHWVDDKLHGRYCEWVYGTSTKILHYKNGLLHGKCIDEGETSNYVDGVLHGLYTKHHNGKIVCSVNYVNGKKDGACLDNTAYGERHNTKTTCFYAQDMLHGEYRAEGHSPKLKNGVYINDTLCYDTAEEYQIAVATKRETAIVPLLESYGRHVEVNNGEAFKARDMLLDTQLDAIKQQVKDAVSSIDTNNNIINVIVYV